ncbi:hypothetical protein SAY86_010159 [Trapa natans]|uniref:Uncharacterized protein n=1 Tax=Trapa natans TaxID=22666 RepID=A0AAN7KZU3_TRANT|nr:hypothetical protein SAY86_010159 [Trapa natans]
MKGQKAQRVMSTSAELCFPSSLKPEEQFYSQILQTYYGLPFCTKGRKKNYGLPLQVFSLHPFASQILISCTITGSSEKPDKLGRSHGNSGRTGIMKQTIKISGGSSSGHGATGGRSPSAAGGQRGGAMIPIYTAGSARNHQSHSGGAGNSRWCSSSPIILATAILICFFMLM